MTVRFSVALCTCNGERYLQEQLDGIAAQKEPPAEIVVCDDDSTDGTLEILARFQVGHPEIPMNVHRNPTRLGTARNFFACARRCAGDFVLFCDQDDVWFPERTAAFRQALEADPSKDVLLCDAWLLREPARGRRRTLWQGHHFGRRDRRDVARGRADAVVARHVFLTGAALAVRRSFLETVPEPVAPFLHDEWIGWFAGARIGLVPGIHMAYRQHGAQQTGVDPSLAAQARRLRAPDPAKSLTLEQGIGKFEALARTVSDRPGYPLAARLSGKIEFLVERHGLPPGPSRILRVAALFLSGRYGTFGSGWRTAVRDLQGRGVL